MSAKTSDNFLGTSVVCLNKESGEKRSWETAATAPRRSLPGHNRRKREQSLQSATGKSNKACRPLRKGRPGPNKRSEFLSDFHMNIDTILCYYVRYILKHFSQ